MRELRVEEIIEKIKKEERFEAIESSGAFKIIIEDYKPLVGTAIHSGGNFREELKEKTLLTSFERWQEEDPHTEEFIKACPIRLIGLDSRYEYDLNREPKEAVYKLAWGKEVWKSELEEWQKSKSLVKHNKFYLVVETLIKTLESKFEKVFVYDLHSYNYKRKEATREYPLFNLGTKALKDRGRYSEEIDFLLGELKGVTLREEKNTTRENDVFGGKGYLARYIAENFTNTVDFAIEVKKVYADENSGEKHEDIIEELSVNFEKLIKNHSEKFLKIS